MTRINLNYHQRVLIYYLPSHMSFLFIPTPSPHAILLRLRSRELACSALPPPSTPPAPLPKSISCGYVRSPGGCPAPRPCSPPVALHPAWARRRRRRSCRCRWRTPRRRGARPAVRSRQRSWCACGR